MPCSAELRAVTVPTGSGSVRVSATSIEAHISRSTLMKAVRVDGLLMPLLELNSQTFIALLLLVGGYRVLYHGAPAGDLIFFYTDGCVEAENASGDIFGSERLEHALASAAWLGADQVMAKVEAEVARFRAGVELQDDATMMVVKVG